MKHAFHFNLIGKILMRQIRKKIISCIRIKKKKEEMNAVVRLLHMNKFHSQSVHKYNLFISPKKLA